MGYLRAVRAISGFLAVLALLILVLGEFFTGQAADESRIWLLIILISALLGVDLVTEHLPLSVHVETTETGDTTRESHDND